MFIPIHEDGYKASRRWSSRSFARGLSERGPFPRPPSMGPLCISNACEDPTHFVRGECCLSIIVSLPHFVCLPLAFTMLGYCSDLSSVQFTRLHHFLTLLLLSNSIATSYCLAMTTSTTSTPTTSTLPAVSSLVHMENLATHANSYASARGLQIEKRTDDGISRYECAPISLLPNAYPSSAFEKAQSLAAPFNLLVDRISRDGEFLQKTLGGGVSEADPYTGKLLKLYKDIYMGEPSPANKFAREADRLGIQRSDLHVE
jgi:hypothetical protein